MILDESLFEDARGVKVGIKRGPYNTSKKTKSVKLDFDDIEKALRKGVGKNGTKYVVYPSSNPRYAIRIGATIIKGDETSKKQFITDASELKDAQEYFNSMGLDNKIDYSPTYRTYSLLAQLPRTNDAQDRDMSEKFVAKDPKGNEMSFEIKDDGTLIVYEGNKVVRQGKTNPEYARKAFSDLGFKEIVREDWKDIAKSDKQPFESIISKEEFDKLISSDKTNHLTVNNYNITWYPKHGLIIRKIVDGRGRPFADSIDKELVLKGYEEVKKEYDGQLNYPNSHLNTPEEIDESAEYDETQPPKGTKYYIKVNTGAKNGGITASYVYGKIKEFPDGTKIGIHKTPYDEKVATDIRTGMRIIGTHSPIYQGSELLEPKKKESELFDQAYELLKSINKDYYNSIPDIKTLVGEEEVNESKNSSLKGKFESQKGFFKEDLPQDFENLPREERIELLKTENERKTLLKAINNIGQLANKNPTIKQDWKVIKDLLRQNNILKEDLSQEEQQEYGLNTLINQLVKSEYDAIDEYNSAIVTLEAEGQGEYTDVIRSIIEDERHHIGNLQEIMNRITPGTEAEFEHGKEEAVETLDEEKPEEVTEALSNDKKLTKEEIIKLALDHFEQGGDVVYSAWDDKDIQEFIDEDGTEKGLMDMFKKYHSLYLDGKAAAYDANHLKPVEDESEEDDPESYPNDFRSDDREGNDYGPSNPWDAPGMRVSDFIKGVR